MRTAERPCCNAIGVWALAFAMLCGAGTALSEQPPQGPGAPAATATDDAWRRGVEQRIASLERENAELRKEVGNIAETRRAVAADATSRDRLADGVTLSPRGMITPPDFDFRKYAAEGTFPGSITLPGTNISIQIGGFVQVDAIADTNAIGSKDSFVVSSIPTSGEAAGQSNISARQTRLFVRTSTPTGVGPLVTLLEGDFFGPDGTDFRLRHAYGEFGEKHRFLGGQTWSTFMDASVYPAIFDYQGPNGMVLVRQPMLRYTAQLSDQLALAVAIEDPNPDLSEDAAVTGSSSSLWPDLTAHARWTGAHAHLQAAGIIRQLTFDPPIGSRSSDIGWGLNVSGHLDLFEPVAKGKQDNVVFQVAGGQGIANYFNDTNGLGLDGFVNSGGDLSALTVWGGFAAYQHYWSPKWASTVGYSYMHVDGDGGQSDDTYKSGHYVVFNLMYYPADRIWLGVEALYGIREDRDGNTGDNGRISFSIQYRF